MPKGVYRLPNITNEPIKSYAPGSPERKALKEKLAEVKNTVVDLPMIIDGKEIRTGKLMDIRPPHEHKHLLGHYHQGDASHIQMAIQAAMKAKPAWEKMNWESRAAIFLKAAELIAGPYRQLMNAVTMLGQSKNAFQAEIDCVCELADFYRFNVKNMYEIYHMQPNSSAGIWDRNVWRPLEGFVFALTPFNFTSIAGNLPGAPVLMGNVCVWKPSKTAVYSAHLIMQILKEAGLPDGVINLVYCSGPVASDVILSNKDFAGIHFTGSTGVFNSVWTNIVKNINQYRTYPRIVGETGGKDYIFADPTAPAKQVATAMVRGAFEYQGQKCSAASRAYIPSNIWPEVRKYVEADLAQIKVGGVEDFTNFVNAVIDEDSFDKLAKAIDNAQASPDAEVILGGKYDKSEGYFIYPTVILAKKPDYVTMQEELFGPVLTVYVYEPDKVEETLDILDHTSSYALTGAIFSQDRAAIERMTERLTYTAGNFYINDKPTGAVVDQQPFGGGRASGTNDKAGSVLNLLRWVSPQAIKETFVPATDYMYPNFLED
ncbi:1-pyrroline-5-carboxylate dehydrogenase [Odoribacter laneus]|jgi:1-pyrroline-5-carboxylate dehydrogenase|uniref:L-glutamate gamma-semialdehyde dehydrogenase n=1 Tax=Odoribacter laneus TaxID=626933 RepID=UPI00033A9051|nr:L-glutamate gamma-semialdehyde dehydrogenase [Odoribacter laneus]MBS1445192.1 L-glutamate gamma-semialdehyde dehydrogenase [Odoribacter sp.]GKI21962.1 1-pyrroline-5-carboxylate dehydrogenase [Odoribacter laneus]GKI26544.1 1-pyrroline-5-carboxylate dehydrogenase [Odoribacter laneus]CCZ80453.1 1-pyrroline-5-carboxylate dehydrogenase [Odoribacter laneus CAG:561]